MGQRAYFRESCIGQTRPQHDHNGLPMAGTKQAPTRQAITLKGSTNLVTEFFKYAANTYVQVIPANPVASANDIQTAFYFNAAYILQTTSIW